MGSGAWLHAAAMLSAALIGLCLGLTPASDLAALAIEPSLMAMLFLVFLSIDLRRMGASFGNMGFLASALLIHFVLTPVMAFVLGLLFFGGSVDLRMGLLMLLVTPCTDWYLVFTSVAHGDTELSGTLLPVNLALQIILLPVYLLVFMGTGADIDAMALLAGMAAVLAVPFLAALALKALSGVSAGASALGGALSDRGDGLQLLFLCIAIAAMFASEGEVLLGNLDTALSMLAPLMLFFVAAAAMALGISRIRRRPFDEATSLMFTSMARNSPLSLAIAVSAFPDSHLVALVLVIGPLVELPVLSIAAALRLRARGGAGTAERRESMLLTL